MKKYLLKKQAELRTKLKEYDEQIRDDSTTSDQIAQIKDHVSKINDELTEINTLLGANSDDNSGDDGKSEDDATEEKSDDKTDTDKQDDGSTDDTKKTEDDSKSGDDADKEAQSRADVRNLISRGVKMGNRENDERRDGRTKLMFARMALGQSVDQVEARDLGIVSGNGTVTVPKNIQKDIISYVQEENGLRKYGTINRSTDTEGYPVLVKKPTAQGHKKERGVANPMLDGTMQFDEVVLDPTEIDGLLTFTKKLQHRSGVNIESAVLTEMQKVYTDKEASYMFTGMETDNINDGSLLKKAVDWFPTADVDTSKGPDVYDALIHFKNSTKKEIRKNSMFFLNTAAVDLLETIKDLDGRPLYKPLDALQNGLLGDVDGRILAHNAHVTDYLYADDTLDPSIPAIYFGDFKSFNIQDVLGSMETQTLNELYATSNMIGVRIYNIVDGQLVYSPLEPTMYKFNLTAKKA